MALHDVDKSGFQRDNPSPNSHDDMGMAPRKAHGTNSTNYVTGATEDPVSGTNTGTAGGGTAVKQGMKRLVAVCPVGVTNDGSTLTTATVAHNLGYAPKVEADLENATITIAGGTVTGANVPIPLFTDASIDTIKSTALNGGVALGAIIFQTWVYAFADETNVYVNFLNATGLPSSIEVTVYLYLPSGL